MPPGPKTKRAIPDTAKRFLEELRLQFSGWAELERIIGAMLSDDRMKPVWNVAPKLHSSQLEYLLRGVVIHASPDCLTDIALPRERRGVVGQSAYHLSIQAGWFADKIELHRDLAAEFWPEPIDGLVHNLRDFAGRLWARGDALQATLDEIPAPSRQGRGIPAEIALANAINVDLEKIGDSRARNRIPSSRR